MKILLSLVALLGVLVMGAESASAASPAYCDGYAKHYANERAGGNAVGGGVGGAVVGGSTWHRYYNDAYYQCVNSGPGYAPAPAPVYAPAPYALPPVGSPDWNYRCSLKFKSFVAAGPGNPGYYTGYDYQQHPCALP